MARYICLSCRKRRTNYSLCSKCYTAAIEAYHGRPR